MNDSEFIIRARRKWVELDATTKNATPVCHRCGISAPTLRKWWRRYPQKARAVCNHEADVRSIPPEPSSPTNMSAGFWKCAPSATSGPDGCKPN